MAKTCDHLADAAHRDHAAKPSGHGCAECLAGGGQWVHLRLCLACGHVGCCDNSPGRHATGHYHQSGHPVIRSYEPGEDWGYCYVHDAFLDELRAMAGEAAPVHYAPKR